GDLVILARADDQISAVAGHAAHRGQWQLRAQRRANLLDEYLRSVYEVAIDGLGGDLGRLALGARIGEQPGHRSCCPVESDDHAMHGRSTRSFAGPREGSV